MVIVKDSIFLLSRINARHLIQYFYDMLFYVNMGPFFELGM